MKYKIKKANMQQWIFEFEQQEKDIYAEDELQNFIDNDLISSEEEGFMLGYLSA